MAGRKNDRAELHPPGPTPVLGGVAEILGDADRDGSWMLVVNGTPQSHVDLEDPSHLEFEYVRRMGHVLDLAAEEGRPIDVVHLGGGALTLPRYVTVTRPGSRQRVAEIDEPLTELVRAHLPLPRTARIRGRAAPAAAAPRADRGPARRGARGGRLDAPGECGRRRQRRLRRSAHPGAPDHARVRAGDPPGAAAPRR